MVRFVATKRVASVAPQDEHGKDRLVMVPENPHRIQMISSLNRAEKHLVTMRQGLWCSEANLGGSVWYSNKGYPFPLNLEFKTRNRTACATKELALRDENGVPCAFLLKDHNNKYCLPTYRIYGFQPYVPGQSKSKTKLMGRSVYRWGTVVTNSAIVGSCGLEMFMVSGMQYRAERTCRNYSRDWNRSTRLYKYGVTVASPCDVFDGRRRLCARIEQVQGQQEWNVTTAAGTDTGLMLALTIMLDETLKPAGGS